MNNMTQPHSYFSRNQHRGQRRSQHGFTLIEILVALAVAGIALTAILKAVNGQLVSAQIMEEKTVAHWVALNVATEIRLQPSWPPVGSKQGETEMLQQQWQWQALTSGTPDPLLRRVDIKVFDQSESQRGSITIFLGKNR